MTSKSDSSSSVLTSPPSKASIGDDHVETIPTSHTAPNNRGPAFWMVILTVCACTSLSALELTCISTTLPTIAFDLQGSGFVWVASAYSLAATASISFGGDMAEAFGRSPAMLASLGIFSIGSALAGSARTMNWLIAARTVQGVGAGGLLSIPTIVLADLVPLKERALYQGLVSLTYALFAAVGPTIGGAIAQGGQWRWVFYMTLPLCGIAALFTVMFLKLHIPQGTILEKLARIDWIGCFLVMASSTSCCIALTWAGVKYAWSSPQVLVPLILGLCGLANVVAFGRHLAKRPIIPLNLLSNRTSLSGYIQTFILPFTLYTAVYYGPLYFQACKDASPLKSGVYTLGGSISVGVVAFLANVSVAYFKSYRAQCYVGWCFYMVGSGLMSIVHENSALAPTIVYSIIAIGGGGILFAVVGFPTLAPLPVTDNGRAITLAIFLRTFATSWATTIGGTVVQNELQKRIPVGLGIDSASFAYAVIPGIAQLPEPLKSQLRKAFADSISVLWQTMVGISGIGFLACILMKNIPMTSELDEAWGMEEKVAA